MLEEGLAISSAEEKNQDIWRRSIGWKPMPRGIGFQPMIQRIP
jgi:hypothetical protein